MTSIIPFGEERQISPFFTVKNVPSPQGEWCEITIRIRWEYAERLAAAAGPFLSAISSSLDLRTEFDKARDKMLAESAARYAMRQRDIHRALFCIARKIYRRGLRYHEAQNLLTESVSGWEGYLPRRKAHLIYHEARKRAMLRMKKKGCTVEDVAALFCLSKQAAYEAMK